MSFNLADVLKDVSELDTGREQIEYIPLDLIDGDSENFYSLSEIESLANNIATIGLQQPLRLRKHPTDEDRYMTVSGHRRREALNLLVKEDPERWREVPCIVQRDTVSPALQQLRLIYANSDTRRMSSADLNEQAAQVEKLLYQLKEEGHEFPGRMRDHVAQVVQVSKTKLAKLKMIRDNLEPCWQTNYKNGILGESSAYELSRMPPEDQLMIFEEKKRTGANIKYLYADDIKRFGERFADIAKCACERSCGDPCINADRKRRKATVTERWATLYCGKCCEDCPDLTSCKSACPKLKDKVKQIKADAKEAQRQKKLSEEERDRPKVEKIQQLWMRFGLAREQAGRSVEEVYKAADMYYAKTDDQKMVDMEGCFPNFDVYTTLPYGYSCRLSDVNKFIAIADLFGCSIDYLLCRTDVRDVAQAVKSVPDSDTLQCACNAKVDVIPGMWYPTSVEPPLDKEIILVDKYGFVDSGVYIGGGMMKDYTCTEWKDVKLWSLLPSEANALKPASVPAKESPLNNSCKTGMSPTGYCGAAACCPEPADCCLNCDKDCNLRCGWVEE